MTSDQDDGVRARTAIVLAGCVLTLQGIVDEASRLATGLVSLAEELQRDEALSPDAVHGPRIAQGVAQEPEREHEHHNRQDQGPRDK